MPKDFGLTWWGQRWLESLTKIDWQNRIPRGARYARNGSVKEITVGKDGVIKARVKGSRPSPYKIVIKVPQFTDKEKNDLVKEIISHPSLVAGLLNRELSEEILELAYKLKLKVFPTSWQDLDMNCSCPDWAVPCKHLAAVIYKLSQEIDNDPFMVFAIHGLDLMAAIKARNIKMDAVELMSVTPFEEFLKPYKGDSQDGSSAEWHPDLSMMRSLTDTLIDLLDENCSFSTGFRERYRATLKKCQRSLARRPKPESSVSLRGMEMSMEINGDFTSRFKLKSSVSVRPKTLDTEHAVELLRSVGGEDLNFCQPSVLLFSAACQYAGALTAKGCVTPQIVQCGSTYRIIWLPAISDRQVAEAVRSLEAVLNHGLVRTFRNTPLQEAATMLLCVFITSIINENSPESDSLSDFFFRGASVSFAGIGEKNTPGGIKSYLSCFHIPAAEEKPVLQVSDSGDGFGLEFSFEIKGKNVPLHRILTFKAYEDRRYALLQRISLLMRFVPHSAAYIDSGAKKNIALSDAEFSAFLTSSIPAIRLLNASVVMPVSLENLARPKPSLSIRKRSSDKGKSFFRIDDMLDFDWKVAVGDEFMDESEFKRIVKSARGLIRFKESFFYVDEEDLKRISDAFADTKGPGRMRLLQAAISGEYDGAPVRLSAEIRDMIKELTSIGDEKVPDAVQAQLRPYQMRGYSWMYKNLRLGFGSIIADDMGLGKTLQVITLLTRMKNDGAFDRKKAMIVVPTGLLNNWESEIDRFSPALTHFRYHGASRDLKAFDTDVLLTTYGVLRSDAQALSKLKWEIQVIDEAQNIKNTDTAQTKAVKSIPAASRVAMSGTPVENRLTEYWSIMDFVNKGYLDSKTSFVKRYALPIEQNSSKDVSDRFRRITAPFMMRRLKSDRSIISDLPDKVTRNFAPNLTTQQAALYQQVVAEYMKTLEDCPSEGEKALFKRQGIVLQMILALKQICDHPALFLKDGRTSSELSGKCEMLSELVRSIVESGEKVLIFTQFREMGEILQQTIQSALGFTPLFYHGGCTLKQRTELVRRFQEIRSYQVFILSLKAAGTGLNLTAASHVIHFDLWWNPAVEAQATDRAYRIGQHSNVLVTRFVTSGTFEERIDRMLTEKKHLADLTVASGESWIGRLSDSELKELVSFSSNDIP